MTNCIEKLKKKHKDEFFNPTLALFPFTIKDLENVLASMRAIEHTPHVQELFNFPGGMLTERSDMDFSHLSKVNFTNKDLWSALAGKWVQRESDCPCGVRGVRPAIRPAMSS